MLVIEGTLNACTTVFDHGNAPVYRFDMPSIFNDAREPGAPLMTESINR